MTTRQSRSSRRASETQEEDIVEETDEEEKFEEKAHEKIWERRWSSTVAYSTGKELLLGTGYSGLKQVSYFWDQARG